MLMFVQMKDLKRQLAQERKRADRLEQRIQELSSTSESKQRQPSSKTAYYCLYRYICSKFTVI